MQAGKKSNPSYPGSHHKIFLVIFILLGSLFLAGVSAHAWSRKNPVPIADAGSSQTVTAGTTAQLDGSRSYDPDGQSITYRWSIKSKPSGSLATLTAPTAAKTGLKTDVAGTYVASLVVKDANASSTASTVSVTATAVASPPPPPSSSTIKLPLYGVTLDDLSKMNAIIESLVHLPYKPTVRVVFDPGTSAAQYYPLLVQLHQYAYVMGEILDSAYFPTTLSYYSSRTNELVSTLKTVVDIWEIANEINGEWLRQSPTGSDSTVASQEQQIGQMVEAAYNIVKNAGGKVAVTLYYNADDKGNTSYENNMDNWTTWPTQFLSATVCNGTDYALFSYYPYDNPDLTATPNWTTAFTKLEAMFPNALVGFGELGTSNTSDSYTRQSGLITKFYPMVNSFADPKFIGGVFWWYYAEQMVPYTTQYWQLLNQTIQPLKAPQ